MRISDWSSDVCSSDLDRIPVQLDARTGDQHAVGQVSAIAEQHLVLVRGKSAGRRLDPVCALRDQPCFRPPGELPVEDTGAHHCPAGLVIVRRSEEHTSELQSLMRISYAVFCLQKKKPR